mmetsp:Transcript_10256/g.31676  ORF Transcript_10256/g.31676 Transcript_10256/m.31676 type:complete len:208 (-) Transcript_10256:33-656(-)
MMKYRPATGWNDQPSVHAGRLLHKCNLHLRGGLGGGGLLRGRRGGDGGLGALHLGLHLRLLLEVVVDRRPDRLLGEHRAVQLHGRQRELGRDVLVGDLHGLVERLAAQHLGHVRGGRDGAAAAEGHELRVLDDGGLGVHLHLQLHDVAALGGALERVGDVGVVLVHLADVPRVAVVVVDLGGVLEPHLRRERRDGGGDEARGTAHGV